MVPDLRAYERLILGTVLAHGRIAMDAAFEDETEIPTFSGNTDGIGHAEIWTALCELYEEHAAIDPMAVASKIGPSAGATAMILSQSAFIAEDLPYHIGAYRREREKRTFSAKLALLAAASQNGSTIEDIQDELVKLTTEHTGSRKFVRFSELAPSVLDDMCRARQHGLPTGLADLDRMIVGLEPKRLYLVAGRPGIGKSALALAIARKVARDYPVGILSAEMSAEENVQRLICTEAGMSLQATRSRSGAHPNVAEKMAKACMGMGDLPILLDDTACPSLAHVQSRARSWRLRDGIGLLIVDHMGLIQADGDNRNDQQGEVSRNLKGLAKELGIPVLALAQLNREVERRTEKRPQLSDLRDSGNLEQDADTVILLYRAGFYGEEQDKKGRPTDHVCELIVAKQRNGPTGTVEVYCEMDTGRFADLEGQRE